MLVYEFYLKDRRLAFESLCDTFYALGTVGKGVKRKADGAEDGTCVYAVSFNANTGWVQLLVDDSTPNNIIEAIEAKIKGLSEGYMTKDAYPFHDVAPLEKPKHLFMQKAVKVGQ